ncbi:MAG: NAD(+) synthase [Lachnospiraceae bacterium]|nr:NAD(+) synthase [Lachnospiraceae bacterium]
MKDGFVKVATVTPELQVADINYNGDVIASYMDEAYEQGAKITVFPELCITGYTCGDLFYQDLLLQKAAQELVRLAGETEGKDGLYFVGLPLSHKGKIYNVAAALSNGEILGLIPKSYLPTYGEFYESRQFTPAFSGTELVELLPGMEPIPMGCNQLFVCETMPNLVVAAELCEDLWTPNPPSVRHAMHGATVIVNLSASDEITGKSSYRRTLVSQQSARLYCGYLYASAGIDESTQDVVYSGHNLIAEAGRLIQESPLFSRGITYGELDVDYLAARRRGMSTFDIASETAHPHHAGYERRSFYAEVEETTLTRHFSKTPFVPSAHSDLKERCEEILNIQSLGLRKRLVHTHCKTAVLGISGGLDSTLALLVTVRAFEMAGLDKKGIIAVTMPGFGTTDRTYDNAVRMIAQLGVTFREVDIKAAVNQHFADIGQDAAVHDVTYENSQARERTQILMDIANKEGGMVIGTGDLSELALGWATYNGDHMSMYGVNGSIPKTLVRHLVRYYADVLCKKDAALHDVLYDVLDTPVSPELLPPENGTISQKTEELVGPYELHDFFLYYFMRHGCSPKKIYRIASLAFADEYDRATILKWEKNFFRRFFAQQFKRSCLPDGPKVGTVALSPRGDWRMPSDASSALWMGELEEL